MEKTIWILTLAGILVALPSSGTTAPSNKISSEESNKRLPEGSVSAKYFKIVPRPLNPENAKSLLSAFNIKPVGKPEISGVNSTWRDKLGTRLAYEAANSEYSFTNDAAPILTSRDTVPDSLIRRQTDILVKSVLKEKTEGYVFANYEITMVQKRDPERKDSVGAPVPAFYIGRYLKKLDSRVVLGDEIQIRVTYGAGGILQSFCHREPDLIEAGTLQIPSKEMVIDSLKKWEKSKTHTRTYTYPFHPDNLGIRSIKPVRIIETYVLSKEKLSAADQGTGGYLVPAITVLAEVVVAKSRKNLRSPPPESPVLLHFHFPCRPASGLCWPDGAQDLQDQIPTPK